MRAPAIGLAALILLATGCRSTPPATGTGGALPHAGAAPSAVHFTNVTQSAGLRWRHVSGASGRFYFPETMGSGCAFLDYDGDGRLDLFLVNSSRLPGYEGKGPFYPALYRNVGGGAFEDVTRRAGLAVEGYGMGVAVGDYDNDGDPDLYLTAMGPNRLFRNNGASGGGPPGTFTDVTAHAGVGDPSYSASAAWFDYDRDGDLDLFVGNYCRWSLANHRVCPDEQGRPHICNPSFFPGVPSRLYRNNGGSGKGLPGTFTDVASSAGVTNRAGKALGVAVFDVDDDGWLDLFVANDREPNTLFRNRGGSGHRGTFTEIGVESGVAYGPDGRARAGMGIDTADLRGEGREDVLIGNFSGERAALFRDVGAGQFLDAAEEVGLGRSTYPFTTFGALFVDYDLDGRPDVCLVNGHPEPNIALSGDGPTFAQPITLFHNEGGRFRDVSAESGVGAVGPIVGRGLATGDYDGDGDPDLLITENNGPVRLLRNDGGSKNAWIAFRLIGTRSPRDGNGARLRLTAGRGQQTAWVRSGGSYCSASESVALFGLGSATRVDRVEIRWSSGHVDRLGPLTSDRVVTVREGGS